MAYDAKTEYCESCKNAHVVRERYVCDQCEGVIYEGKPQSIDWFGKGVFSEVRVLAAPGKSPREMVVVEYEPFIDRGKIVPLHFCSLTCALSFFREDHPGQHEADRITINGSVASFAQLPINGFSL